MLRSVEREKMMVGFDDHDGMQERTNAFSVVFR